MNFPTSSAILTFNTDFLISKIDSKLKIYDISEKSGWNALNPQIINELETIVAESRDVVKGRFYLSNDEN